MTIRFRRSFALALLLVATLTFSAQAHFVWVAISDDGSTASLYFGEGPFPSEAALLGHVAQSEAFARTADGKYVPLKLEKKIEEDGDGSWSVTQDGSPWQGMEAVCDYGVLAKGDAPFWLKYYGKHADASTLKNKTLCESEKLALDIVPSKTDEGIQLKALFHGKPVEGCEFVIYDDTADPQERTTDAQGNVLLKDLKPVIYSVRAKWVEEKSGEHDGKKYDSIRHYSTVSLNLTADDQ
ncbi:DUF4198 domain-containing protein [Blastopirellula marina]|uniref:DUF4198 domain-containing protein n=1 Tax=Blastopirellula marina TaxID=124 RepID=A0A2S8GK03_9BACT|nr:DUF4198 domain-containing protein [Blastopirellula marina]PQO44765.1 hypothetical protein C5Y93_16830 [Blastopirellula marina]